MSSQSTAQRPPPAPDESMAAAGFSPRSDKSRKRRRRRKDLEPSGSADHHGEGQDTCSLAAADRDGVQCGRDNSRGLPETLLLEISAAFACREQCIFLALKLKFGEDEVCKLFNTPFNDQMAHNIIKKWMEVHYEQAAGPALHTALCDIERQDLADQFKERLLGREAKSETQASGTVGLNFAVPKSGATADTCPSWDLLHQIAGFLPKRKHSVQLAQSLGLGKDYVKRLKEGMFMTSRAALNVLHTWRHEQEKRATGKVLFYALTAIKKREVAVHFGEELLGRESTDDIDIKGHKLHSADASRSGTATDTCPSWDILHQIAAFLPKRKHSVQLAQSLGLGKDYVKRLKEGMFMTSRASLNVLNTWRHEQPKQATGQVLFDALGAINKRDVAVRFGEELLGLGLSCPAMAQSDHQLTTIRRDRVNNCNGNDSCPDYGLLQEIGKEISSHEECLKLASKLTIGDENLHKLADMTFTETLVYEVLVQWKKTQNEKATGPVLHAALCQADRQDLAARFEDRLFGREIKPSSIFKDVQFKKEREDGGAIDQKTAALVGNHRRGDDRWPDDKLLKQIGEEISSHGECVNLALKLKIDDDNLHKFHKATFTKTLAYEVLMKWREVQLQSATGSVLHAALCDADRADLADRFQDRLLRRDFHFPRETHAAVAAGLNTDVPEWNVVERDDCCPDDVLLEDIGKAISSHEQCVKFALALKIGDDNLRKFHEATFTDTLAYEVLMKWMEVQKERATGSVLHAALCDVDLADLADRYQERLLRRDVHFGRKTQAAAAMAVNTVVPVGNCPHGDDLCPDIVLLKEIAEAISSHEERTKLALELKIGDDNLHQFHKETFTEAVAYEMLAKWMDVQKERATGSVLHTALCDAGREDLADRFQDRLLRREIDQLESEKPPVVAVDSTEALAEASFCHDKCPSMDLLKQIASQLPDQKQCVQLAESLGLRRDFLEQLKDCLVTMNSPSLNVLCTWRQQQSTQATGHVLYDALTAINEQDVAEHFREKLLGKDYESPDLASDDCYKQAACAAGIVCEQREDVAGRGLQDSLLLEVSAAFSNRQQCIILAVKLNIGESDLELFLDTAYTDRMAYTIMKKWMEIDQEASGPALHTVLCNIDRQGLAEPFKKRLLLRGQPHSAKDQPQAEIIAAKRDCLHVCDGAEHCPNDTLLKVIGNAISSHEQCMKLALELKISDDYIYKLNEADFTETLAYEVLRKWMEVQNEKATGSVLHNALCNVHRQDLADRFEDQLFGRDVRMTLSMTEDSEAAALALDDHFPSSGSSSLVLPSVKLLTEIADHLPKLRHSVRLAESLGLSADFVQRLREGIPEGTATQSVLFKWKQKESRRATGKVLFNALIAINKRDVAAGFAEELLGQDDVDWEDYGYGEKHRGFFRLLRRRNVDVFAVYEHVQFSHYFLGRLHQHSVLSRPEYDQLMLCLEAMQQRLTLNKKLMDIINLKPPQLQDLFVDLLFRYQAKLVNLDKELSALPDAKCQKEVTTIPATEIHGDDLLVDFKEELMRSFNQLLIVRPVDFMPSEHIQPVSDMYVTLSVISYEEALKLISGPQQRSSSQLLKEASRVEAQSKHSREIVDLHSLFGSHQGTQTNRVLIFGSAGSGKSLSTLKILSEWNNQNSQSPFKRFEAIVYITGRERARLRTNNVSQLWSLQQMGFNDQQELFFLNYFSHHSEKVLFLVDGWDEAGEDGLLKEDMVLNKILHGELFPQSAIIVTSRPAPTAYHLLEKCQKCYSLTGFNDRRLLELFNLRLNNSQQASKLFHALSQASYLHVKAAIQKTPLFAAMLIELYMFKETLPVTITALYQLMMESIRSRYVEWVKETQAKSIGDRMMFNGKLAKTGFDSAVKMLSSLAFAGLLSNQVTFTSTDVLRGGLDVINSRFGLLSEVKEVGERDEVLYHFSHMTWQEYLGACNLAADMDFIKKLRMCVSIMGVGEHTHMFWRFVAGLVSSRLLADLVFELLKASSVSGQAPWETEFRLFLLDCVAENIRMRQMLNNPSYTDVNIHLAAKLITSVVSEIDLNGCMLDTSHLSSLVVVLEASPWIKALKVNRCRLDHQCPTLMNALDHLKLVELDDLSGQENSAFILRVISSLRNSHTIGRVVIVGIPLTAECTVMLAQLINDSQSLTGLNFMNCKLGSPGLACLSSNIVHSSSLRTLTFNGNSFSGAGGFLCQICSRLPQLQKLDLSSCGLDNDDFADVLPGLQGNLNLTTLHVGRNNLTDEFAAPLLQFAASRNHLIEQIQISFACYVYLGGNNISEGVLLQLAVTLPPMCHMFVEDGQIRIGYSYVQECHHVDELQSALEESTDGHISYQVPGLGDHGASQAAQFLKTEHASRLKTLSLSMCNIGDSGVSSITEALPKSRLRGLDLSHNQLTVAGFHKLLSALSTGCSLHYLNVGHNPLFTNDTFSRSELTPSILNLSQSIHQLNILGMSSTSFTDNFSSFENSPLAVMSIPSLFALDLSNNSITDNSIAMVMNSMNNMQYLSLSGNKISSDGCKQLIAKAEELLENVDSENESTCRLQWIWLGGNSIDESVFAECTCKAITCELMTILNILPKVVSAMFSASPIANSLGRHLLSLTSAHVYSPIMVKMRHLVQSHVFVDFMKCVTAEIDGECFDRWLMRAVHAIVYHTDSDNPVNDAHCVLNLFSWIGNWYLNTRAYVRNLAVACCKICIIDELMITYAMYELELEAEETLTSITEQCALGGDYLSLAVQYMSGLAEHCRQRELHSVAECLLQQMEFVSQQV